MHRHGKALFAAWATIGMADAAWADDIKSPYALDDIVVTGTRQDSILKDLAGNTTVIGTPDIDFTAPQRPSEILNQVPGVNIQQGSGEEHLTAIRSPVLNGGAGAGSFLYLEDGIPLRAAGFADVNGLLEANPEQSGSIEVVRGPGSALYGSNAVHGLINFIPRAPSATAATDLDGEIGMYGLRRMMASTSDTIGSEAFRISALDSHEGGWRNSTGMDEQKFVARNVWTGNGDNVTTTVSANNLNQQTGGYLIGTDAYTVRAIEKTNPVADAYRNAASIRAMSRWQHDLSDTLQLSLTPYMRYTGMNFMEHYLPDHALQQTEHASIGMQSALYKSLPGGHSIIFGTDLEYTNGNITEWQGLPTFTQGTSTYPLGMHYDFTVGATVLAPYVHSEWQVLDHTRVTAGIRLEQTQYDYINNISSGTFNLFQRTPSRNDSFTTVTPKLGAVQDWQNGLASYVNLTRGARAPQVSDLYELQSQQVVGQVKPETMDSFEIGNRGKILGANFDMAAFWMTKNHYFYRDVDGLNVIDGKTEHRGVELGLSAPLSHGFDAALGGSYALHTYEFNNPESAASNTYAAVTKGSSMPEAPRAVANLRLGYAFMPGARAEAEWVHMGSYFTDNANMHSYGGYDVFNLRASAPLNDTVTLHAKIINIGNLNYASRATFSVTKDEYFPGDPLTIMGGATVHF